MTNTNWLAIYRAKFPGYTDAQLAEIRAHYAASAADARRLLADIEAWERRQSWYQPREVA